jgi:RNA polymerase sigma-70 factor (ECF subfamily)
VKHFASRQREAAQRLKRGGGLNSEPLEEEILAAAGMEDRLSPESEFDRQWALTVLSRALATLESECLQEGRSEFFGKIKPHLAGESAQGDLDKLATTMAMHPDALRKALQRLRRRWRENVKSEIAATLDSGANVQEEMEALLAALRA